MRHSSAQKNLARKPAAACGAILIAFALLATTGSVASQHTPGGTSSIVVNQSESLLFCTSQNATTDSINGSIPMPLNSGIFNTAGLSEHGLSGTTMTSGLGAITLSNNSTLDLGAGASVSMFAESNAQTWTGTLSTAGLTGTEPSQMALYSDSGTAFLGSAGYASDLDGEVVAAPEPTSWLAAALAFGALAFTQRRRMRKALHIGHSFALKD